jgi:hypothetical protein
VLYCSRAQGTDPPSVIGGAVTSNLGGDYRGARELLRGGDGELERNAEPSAAQQGTLRKGG